MLVNSPPDLDRPRSGRPRLRVRVGQHLGKYRLRRRLARGGCADVFEARDTIEEIEVALKVPLDPDKDTIDAFCREIRQNAQLNHPNILPLKNADIADGVLYATFPLGEESLEERLGRRISPRRAMDFGSQLLAGLGFAHARGLVHCDVKPDNVIVFPGNRLRLADFGLAKSSARALRGSSSGTLEYMAPEHRDGHPSMRSDVFSAALVIYQMLTGTLPTEPFRWPLAGYDRLVHRAPPHSWPCFVARWPCPRISATQTRSPSGGRCDA